MIPFQAGHLCTRIWLQGEFQNIFLKNHDLYNHDFYLFFPSYPRGLIIIFLYHLGTEYKYLAMPLIDSCSEELLNPFAISCNYRRKEKN